MPSQSAASVIQIGLEATPGTQAASPLSVPVKNPHVLPKLTWVEDTGLRGSPVDLYDQIAGVYHDQYDLEGAFYADTFPLIAMAALGGTDTKTGAGPYLHTVGLKDDGTGSQPWPLSILDWDGYNGYAMTGARIDSLRMTLAAEQDCMWQASVISGNTPLSNTSAPSPSYSTEALPPGWSFAVTVGGSSIAYVERMEINIERKTKPIFTGGAQSPYTVFAGTIGVSGTIECVVASNADPFTAGSTPYATTRQGSPLVMLVQITDPATNHYCKFQMSNVQFTDPDRNRGKEYISYTAAWKATANTTDSTASKWSPIKFAASNAVSTQYVGS